MLLAACAGPRPRAACAAAPAPADTVFVVDHGWHTDLAVPAAALRGEMRRFRALFPGMRFLLVGFGRRTFMTAPVTGPGDFLVGPFPGRGALLVAGLSAPPDRAYATGNEARLPLDEAGARGLSAFLWRSFRLRDGQPEMIARGFFPGSLFFAAAPGYSGLHTCNGWTADALRAAGEPPSIDAGFVPFSWQLMGRLERAGGSLCRIDQGRTASFLP